MQDGERENEKRTGAIQSLAPAVAPGYGWSESKNWELQLPGFHSDVDAGQVERKKERVRQGEKWNKKRREDRRMERDGGKKSGFKSQAWWRERRMDSRGREHEEE